MGITSVIIGKLLLAALIGGVLGAEREYRSKSAGFRTLTMICLGAALFTLLSQLISTSTPDRIAANVVVGIGFVGAGVIFKGDVSSKVTGITTAAMIWVTAALGMAVGAGYLLIATVACGVVLLVLFLFSLLEGWIDRVNQIRNYKIVCTIDADRAHRMEDLFKSHRLKYKRVRQAKSITANIITSEWVVQGAEKDHRHVAHELMRDPSVMEFEY